MAENKSSVPTIWLLGVIAAVMISFVGFWGKAMYDQVVDLNLKLAVMNTNLSVLIYRVDQSEQSFKDLKQEFKEFKENTESYRNSKDIVDNKNDKDSRIRDKN